MTEKASQNQSGIFITGVVLTMLFSVVIGIFHIGVLYLCGFPILGLLIGIMLVWFSEKKIEVKIIFTLIPIPLILITFLLFMTFSRAETEIFLIPKHLRGEIVVFYEEACGQPPLYEDKNRIYQIPESGVLITGFKKNNGHLSRKFYFVDESGNRTEILQLHWQDFDTEKQNWHSFYSNSADALTKDTVGAFWGYGSQTYGLSQNSFSYVISTYRDFEEDQKKQWLESKRFAATAKNLLNECRQSRK